jgi:CheY-like chemotaxis protein
MGGRIWLDESYHIGIEGCPGARFFIELDTRPVAFESLHLLESTELFDSFSIDFDKSQLMNSPALSCKAVEDLPEKLSVLFVDDDMILRKLFARSVKRMCPNWTVEEAGNGETALQMADSTHFDLIFLDHYMTSVDKQLLGTETAHALRGKGFEGFICGLSANDNAHSFIKAGADAFMIKPFPCKPEPLTHELRCILSSKRS